MTTSVSTLLKAPFLNYQFDLAYDEMFEAPGVPRAHYQALFQTLLELPPEELRKSQQAADLSFLHQGITFTVYGNEEGTERIFPNDLLPRIIPDQEWRKIEQRADPADRGAESVPGRHLPRRPHSGGWHRSARTRLQLPPFPPRNARPDRSPRNLRQHLRHRPGPPARWQFCRA